MDITAVTVAGDPHRPSLSSTDLSFSSACRVHPKVEGEESTFGEGGATPSPAVWALYLDRGMLPNIKYRTATFDSHSFIPPHWHYQAPLPSPPSPLSPPVAFPSHTYQRALANGFAPRTHEHSARLARARSLQIPYWPGRSSSSIRAWPRFAPPLASVLSTHQNRALRTPKGDVDSAWSHDLFESHNSLSARLNITPAAPRAALNPIAQKAIRAATAPRDALAIKGAGAAGNVVEVSGLVSGTTPEDVAAIFKRCGQVIDQRSVSGSRDEPRIRISFKTASAAAAAVQKFDAQPADGKILSVRVVGTSAAATTLGGRLGGADGLGLVREEGSVDVLMDANEEGGS